MATYRTVSPPTITILIQEIKNIPPPYAPFMHSISSPRAADNLGADIIAVIFAATWN